MSTTLRILWFLRIGSEAGQATAPSGSFSNGRSRTTKGLFRSPRYRVETSTGRFFASNCACRMVMGAAHGAVDQMKLVGRDPRMVQRVQDILPQARECPAAELAADRRPLAEPFRKIPPRRSRSGDPENAIRNRTMIGWLAPIRMPNGMDEPLEKGPLIVRYQVPRQDRFPRRDDLESQVDDRRNPFCQHDLDHNFLRRTAFLI